jgi:carboxymethylenebutenolidase
MLVASGPVGLCCWLLAAGFDVKEEGRALGEMISVPSGDGEVGAYLATPEGKKGPGVLLMHAWWGLNEFFTRLADRLAGAGFVVIAPDLYGGKTGTTIAEAEELLGELENNEGYKEAIKHEEAALDYLLKHPSVDRAVVGAIGFSMGAAYATWLATLRPELEAVVLVYGGSDQGGDFGKETGAAFLGHFAEGDEWEPTENVRKLEEQLREAGRDVSFHYYSDVGHWFMENNRADAYNEEAAELAWERTVRFLHSKLM